MTYRTWSERLPREVEVCPLQLPGRGSRLHEAPFTSMTALVEAMSQAILPHLNKPFALFGHSMGAAIGFELARRLRREGGGRTQPVKLFVSGRRAPQIPYPPILTYDLPEQDFLEELRRLNGTPLEVLKNPELMELMLPTLRADFSVIQTYTYTAEPPLDCPISVYGGLQDYEVGIEQLEAWREQTTASFSLQMLPGDHFFVNTSPPLLHSLGKELETLLLTVV